MKLALLGRLRGGEAVWRQRGARIAVQVSAQLEEKGQDHEFVVSNLSPAGFHACVPPDWAVGDWFRIRLEDAFTREARIVWQREGSSGCEFLVPLSREELARLVRDDRGAA